MKPGRLEAAGLHAVGGWWLESWMRCRDCRTMFRAVVAKLTDAPRRAMCNSHVIEACPWCRPDSQPWKWGRGK